MAKVRVSWEPAADDLPVKLFEVYNTAHNGLLVLAVDRSTALDIAYAANHIHFIWSRKDKSYPHVAEVRDPSSHRKLADCAGSVQSAIVQCVQGTVHSEGDHVCIGYEVFGDSK